MTEQHQPAIGPYTPARRAGDWVVCSGQLGLKDGAPAGTIDREVRLAVESIARLLAEHGAVLGDVAKTTVFLADIGDFAAMNEAYVASFGEHRPARSAFAVGALPLGAHVEIEAWAYAPGGATG